MFSHEVPEVQTRSRGSLKQRPRGPRVPQPLQAAQVPDALLTVATMRALTGESVSTIYRRWADPATDPLYPRPIKLGKRCTRVKAAHVMAWLKAQQPIQPEGRTGGAHA